MLIDVDLVFLSDIPLPEKVKYTKTVQLLECLNQVNVQFRNSNDTAKLWLTYMEMMEDLMMFIGSIRLSNMEGYYHILCKMMPTR